jgi:hypothetical protein
VKSTGSHGTTYRLRTNSKTAKFQNYTLAVPSDVARELLEQDIVDFTFELTEEGILYRPLHLPGPKKDLPGWLKGNQE